jgi:hypothetical protein
MKCKIAVMVLAGLMAASALAQDRLGLGVIAGEPTGLSAKYWLDEEHAIDAAAAWSFWDGCGFELHSDFLWHDFDLLGSSAASDCLPLYCGVGARLKFRDDECDHHDNHDTVFGLRVPVGISYLFDGAPIDVFAEIAPIVDLTPHLELNFSVAVGVRFYLK